MSEALLLLVPWLFFWLLEVCNNRGSDRVLLTRLEIEGV